MTEKKYAFLFRIKCAGCENCQPQGSKKDNQISRCEIGDKFKQFFANDVGKTNTHVTKHYPTWEYCHLYGSLKNREKVFVRTYHKKDAPNTKDVWIKYEHRSGLTLRDIQTILNIEGGFNPYFESKNEEEKQNGVSVKHKKGEQVVAIRITKGDPNDIKNAMIAFFPTPSNSPDFFMMVNQIDDVRIMLEQIDKQ